MGNAIHLIAPKGRIKGHAIRWFVVDPHTGRKDPRPSGMWASGVGFDVMCECGWQSRTGGAVEAEVKRLIAEHKWDAANGYA